MARRTAAGNGSRMRRGTVTVMALVIIGTRVTGVGSQPASVGDLERQVEDFLGQWITERNPGRALEQHLSAKVDRDDFLPTERGTVRRYPRLGDEVAATGLSPEASRIRMRDYLSEILGTVDRTAVTEATVMLAPFGNETDEDVFELLAARDLAVESFAELPLRHYRVREWDDISWTASGMPGHHTLSPSFMEEQGIEMRAVVGRIRMLRYPDLSMLIVMLWANEAASSGSGVLWRLWGVIPVLTE